jgi:hypothetical protein
MQGKAVPVHNYAQGQEDTRRFEGRTIVPSIINVRIRWKWSASRSDRFITGNSPVANWIKDWCVAGYVGVLQRKEEPLAPARNPTATQSDYAWRSVTMLK